jgi:hypothetical protein
VNSNRDRFVVARRDAPVPGRLVSGDVDRMEQRYMRTIATTETTFG